MNVDKAAEKRTQAPLSPKSEAAKNVTHPVNPTEDRYRAMVQLRGRGPAAAMVLGEAIEHHLWQSRALDMLESHSFRGVPGENRQCQRCTYQLVAHWRSPQLPVPPTCKEVADMRAAAQRARDEELRIAMLAERATRRDALNWQREQRSRGNTPLPSPSLDELEKQLGDVKLG